MIKYNEKNNLKLDQYQGPPGKKIGFGCFVFYIGKLNLENK